VRVARLAVGRRALRHLDEDVRLGVLEAGKRVPPMVHTGMLGQRSTALGQGEDGGKIETVRSVNEAVAGVRDAHDHRGEPVPPLELLSLRVERAQQPPADGAETEDPDPH
jgi:hypothetical protein